MATAAAQPANQASPFHLSSVFGALATVSLGAAGLVAALARHPGALAQNVPPLVAMAAIFALLFRSARHSLRPRFLWLALCWVAALAYFPARFFGPNSGFAAIVAVLLIFVGLLSREDDSSSRVALVVCAVLMLSQAVAFALPLAGVVGDNSMVVVAIPGHPWWHHALAHLTVHAVYVSSFVVGRALHHRYTSLSIELETGLREAAQKRALLAEARLEYQAAVAASRAGIFTGRRLGPYEVGPLRGRQGTSEEYLAVNRRGAEVSLLVTPAVASASVEVCEDNAETTLLIPLTSADSKRPAIGVSGLDEARPDIDLSKRDLPSYSEPLIPLEDGDDLPASIWSAAYDAKIASITIGLTAVCVGGAALFAVILSEPLALIVSLLGLAGILVATWSSRVFFGPKSRWPWFGSALASVAAAYGIGFNSAFACFLVVFMFTSGLFQSAHDAASRLRLAAIPVAAIGGTVVVVVLILVGVIPDAANVKVRQPGAPLGEAIALHAVLISIYIGAFLIGRSLDRRIERLGRRARLAGEEAAAQEHLLSGARAEIERLLASNREGLFSSLLLGDYAVGDLLGRGGMGEVYAAEHVVTKSRVAIKVLRFDRVAHPSHLALFTREAETLQKISSPHVARVLEVSDFASEVPFIVMEYIDGEPLDSLLASRARLEAEEVRSMLAEIAAGLATVHRAGVVHRDIKPSNIVLAADDPDSRWKLVDFGVASIGETERGTILGTPRYMSPEQADGHQVDARSDLFSLALVAYRALTGTYAIGGDSPSEVAAFVRERGVKSPREFVAMSGDLELVFRIGLAADPDHRFASAEELRDAFEDAFADRLEAKTRARGRAQLAREPWAIEVEDQQTRGKGL